MTIPPEKLPSHAPPARLRHALAEQREAGAEFEEAWRPALTFALRGLVNRRAWRTALEETRPAWASAYLRHAAPRPERALTEARDLSDRELALSRGEMRWVTAERQAA